MDMTAGHSGSVPHVVVAALTYCRLEGVRLLLDELTKLEQNPARPYRLTVVIVDNDASGSSRETVQAFADTGKYALHYVVEERQGIPIARNRAMDEAPADADLFCFLDDDEWTSPGWLDAMLEVRAETGADIVYGRIETVYPEGVSRYLVRSKVLDAKTHGDKERIGYAASNNVMMDLPKLRALGVRFREAMRFTGGSDYLFFREAIDRGMRIHYAWNALVYDVYPVSRVTWKWVLQRQYRLGNTFAVSERIYGSPVSRAKKFAVGVMRMGLGAALSPAIPFSPYWGMRAYVHMIRGAGIAVGTLGHAYEEYAPDKLAAPTAPSGGA